MRDIARRAGVGLATLLRHFPTREALYEGLLCTNLDALTQKADQLETATSADESLVSCFANGWALPRATKALWLSWRLPTRTPTPHSMLRAPQCMQPPRACCDAPRPKERRERI